MELILLEDEHAKGLGPDGSVTTGGVGDAARGEHRQEPGEEPDPGLPRRMRGIRVTEHAGAVDDIGIAVQDRADEPGSSSG